MLATTDISNIDGGTHKVPMNTDWVQACSKMLWDGVLETGRIMNNTESNSLAPRKDAEWVCRDDAPPRVRQHSESDKMTRQNHFMSKGRREDPLMRYIKREERVLQGRPFSPTSDGPPHDFLDLAFKEMLQPGSRESLMEELETETGYCDEIFALVDCEDPRLMAKEERKRPEPEIAPQSVASPPPQPRSIPIHQPTRPTSVFRAPANTGVVGGPSVTNTSRRSHHHPNGGPSRAPLNAPTGPKATRYSGQVGNARNMSRFNQPNRGGYRQLNRGSHRPPNRESQMNGRQENAPTRILKRGDNDADSMAFGRTS